MCTSWSTTSTCPAKGTSMHCDNWGGGPFLYTNWLSVFFFLLHGCSYHILQPLLHWNSLSFILINETLWIGNISLSCEISCKYFPRFTYNLVSVVFDVSFKYIRNNIHQSFSLQYQKIFPVLLNVYVGFLLALLWFYFLYLSL